jgi:hypothetical protein
MQSIECLDERLRRSVRLLRAWNWMTAISERPDEALEVLTTEARELVRLGPQHPARWRDIGALIVEYYHLIEQVKQHRRKGQAA